jgi:hypothetical protein
MDHPALAVLRHAFDAAAANGTSRPVWWRDDDAVDVTSALDALSRAAGRHGAPLALAVIPVGARAALLARAADEGWAVLQHGVSHRNHQPSGKPAELGDGRAVDDIVAECLSARARIAAGPSFLPVMVPPWNRMRGDLAPALAAAGWHGLSLWGGAPDDGPPRRVDTHIDPIAWHADRALVAPNVLVTMAERAIAQPGPIGLLTHHLVHTADVAAFVDALAAMVAGHPGARWATATELWGAT